MNCGIPWTVHLNGIAAILEQRNSFTCAKGRIKNYTSFLGVLDLPIYTLGRKSLLRNIWYNHCRFQHGIEVITGLPYSLIDLICQINEPRVLVLLKDLTLEGDSTTQSKVWNVTRHAAIIAAMDLQHCHLLDSSQVRHVIDLLHDLRATIADQTCQLRNMLLLPLVIAGIHLSGLNHIDNAFVIDCIADLSNRSLDAHPYYKGAIQILQELWYRRNGRSADQIARDLGLEQSLF